MKTCSVIVPFYNAAAYLPMCLSSLTHQTYATIEILLVNDGSTDDSMAIAEAFAAVDNRVKILSQANQGQAAARNRAMDIATGEYVYFVDSDDYIDFDYIEKLIEAIGDMDVLHIGSGSNYYHYTAPWKRLYKRSFIEQHQLRFSEDLRHYEDIPFALNMWAAHPTHTCQDIEGYHYTLSDESNSHSGRHTDRKAVYDAIRKSKASGWLKAFTLLRLKIYFLIHH